MVGFESRSATNPRRTIPPTAITTPTISASIEASATARLGSPFAPRSGMMVAAIIGPSEESGPSTSTFDGPKIA